MDKDQIKELQNNGPSFLQENEMRRKKWEHLTDDLSDYDRLSLETLFENTQKWIQYETTTTGNVGTFTTYAFPIIRKIWPNMFASELVSVQPIPMPTAMIFYLDFEYGTAFNTGGTPDIAVDTQMDGYPATQNFSPLYAGGYIRGDFAGTGDGSEDTFDLTYGPVEDESELVYVDGTLVSSDDYTLNVSGGGGTNNGQIVFAGGSEPGDGAAVTVDYRLNAAVNEGGEPNRINLRIASDSVFAETKKLKAEWTIEGQQDLNAYHNLNMESELMNVVSDTVRREIDQLILMDLRSAAASAGGAGVVNWSSAIGAGYNGSQREWDLTLYDALIDANQLIYNRRGVNANWIVAGPNACSRLEKLEGFTEQHRDWAITGMGMERFGVLKNRFTVYKDPWAAADSILMGYKGNTMFDTGYVYSPYIPLYTSPTIIDPDDFTPRKGIMSRYARKLVDPGFYATITIT